MLGFGSSLSALQASQVAINTIAHNIANANTPDYHRQVVHLVDRAPILQNDLWVGTGVEVARINQIASAAIESALTRNIADQSQADQALQMYRQIENHFATGEGSIHQRFQQFFDEAHSLQSQPSDLTGRRVFVRKGLALANQIRSIASQLSGLQSTVRQQIRQTVDTVIGQLATLSQLNRQIKQAQAAGGQPNDLLDQHQHLVNQIAENIDIQAIAQPFGFSYQLAGNRVAFQQTTFEIAFEFTPAGTVQFTAGGNNFELEFDGGRLGALGHIHNQAIPDFQHQLETLTLGLIDGVDHLHSMGIGLDGEFGSLIGNRSVSSPTIALVDAVLPFQVERGELYISITDQSTGERTLNQIMVDPSKQTLQDLAADIDALPNLQAIINSDNQTLSVIAEPGYAFDFTGRLPTQPDRSTISGDAVIQFAGNYSGTANDQYQFQVVGSGTVGVTSNLSLRVTDAAGQEVGTFNLGEGYEPGTLIDLGQGVSLRIESGQLNDGDSFSTHLVADSDTGHLLVALGLNTFFEGTSASTLGISRSIAEDPAQLAMSRSGEPGDAFLSEQLGRFREQALFPGDRTIGQYLTAITSAAAIEVNELTALQADLSAAANRLFTEREAISGVDPNEEMVRMLQFQRSFQASVRVITTIDETLVELMNMVR